MRKSSNLTALFLILTSLAGTVLLPQLATPRVHADLTNTGDTVMTTTCIGLLPATADCINADLQPFENVVYDRSGDGLYNTGEPVIAGTSPADGTVLTDDPSVHYADSPPGTPLSDDPKILFADNTVKDDPKIKYYDAQTSGIGFGVWNPGPTPARECAFYDANSSAAFDAGDTAITGTCPGTGTVKDDGRIKYSDVNNDGVRGDTESVIYDNNLNNRYNPGILTEVLVSSTIPFVGNGVRDTNEAVVYDSNGSGTYTTAVPADFVMPFSTGPILANPSVGDVLKDDPLIRYDESTGDASWSNPKDPGTTEAVVYDTSNNGAFDQGEPVLTGTLVVSAACPSPPCTFLPSGNRVWDLSLGEPVFADTFDVNFNPVRVTLFGTPSTASGNSVRDDPKILFADTNGNLVLNGVVKVSAHISLLGGTFVDTTEEDVDAFQAVFHYDNTVLKPMRDTLGGILPNSGVYEPKVIGHCGFAGGSTLDTIVDTIDEGLPEISSSSLCIQTPRGQDQGIGCNPAFIAGCLGDGFGGPLQDFDAMSVQFMVMKQGLFTFTQVIDRGGTPGSKIIDIDPSSTTTLGLALVDGTFFNLKAAVLSNTSTCTDGTANKPITCTGSAVGGVAPYAFSWSAPGSSNPSGTGDTFTTSYSSPGMPIVTATVTDSASPTPGTASKDITVNITPQVLAITASCSDATVGKTVSCTASASGGVGPYSFSWSAPGAMPPSGTGPTFTTVYSNIGQKTITATVTDSQSPPATASRVITVNITPQPLTITASCSDSTVGKDVSCTASASGGVTPFFFSWSAPGSSSPTGTGATFTTTYSTTGTKIITATVTDSASPTPGTASKDITVNITPQGLSITASCGDGTGTAGKPIACTASATGGTGTVTITWVALGSSNPSGNGGTFSTSYNVKGGYTITATATDGTGAMAHKDIPITISSQTLVLNANCDASAVANHPVSCTASTTGGHAPITISWSAPGSSNPAGTGGSFSTSYSVKGVYHITVQASDTNGMTTPVQDFPVTVSSEPLSLSASCDSSALASEPVSCSGSTTGGHAPITISWSAPGSSNPSGTGTSFSTSYAVKGTYHITVQAGDTNGMTTLVQDFTVAISSQTLVLNASCDSSGTATVPVSCLASTTGGHAPVTISWSAPGSSNPAGTGTTFSTTYAVEGTYHITVEASDTNGMTTPVQDFTVTISSQTLVLTASCSDGTTAKPVSCTASTVGGHEPITITWSAPGSSNPAATGGSFSTSYSVKGQYIINVKAEDSNNVMESKDLTVTILPQHDVGINSVTSDVTTVAVGGHVAFTVSVTNFGATDQQVIVRISLSSAGKPTVEACNTTGMTTAGSTAPFSCSWDTTGFALQTYSSSATVEFSDAKTDENPGNNQKAGPDVTVVQAKPQLVIDSYTVSPSTVFVTEQRTFTAAYSGGTGPFTCTFTFGDGTPSGMVDNVAAQSCSTTHTYLITGSFTASVRVVGQNPSDDASTSASVTVQPEPRFARGKLHWTHHLLSPSVQTFRTIAFNPSTLDLVVRIDLVIEKPTGGLDFCPDGGLTSPCPNTSFTLDHGQLRVNVPFTYTPSDGLGKYCLTATLKYGIDTNQDGILQDSEVLGTGEGSKSGCFAWV